MQLKDMSVVLDLLKRCLGLQSTVQTMWFQNLQSLVKHKLQL